MRVDETRLTATYLLANRKHGTLYLGSALDLVHRITPLAPVVPSSLAGRCARLNVPLMLGPLNGGVPWPKEYPELRAAEREWLYPATVTGT